MKVKIKKKKKSIKSENEIAHKSILKSNLSMLMHDLLPLVVKDFKKSNKKGRSAYAVTNLVAEIRQLIAQIENSVDSGKLISEISREIALTLRASVNRMSNHLIVIKQSLPSKIKDSASRKIVDLLIDSIIKEYEQNVIQTLSVLDVRVSESVRDLLKTSKITRRKKI